jgi:hypothetical protein
MVNPLRCEAHDGDHFHHELRGKVAAAIREYPNADAEWWIGPEAVLGEVERHLGWDNANSPMDGES